MSIELLYPDNRSRGKRVNQLVTQISTIQSGAKISKSVVSDQIKTIDTKTPDVLHAHGLQPVEEVKEKLTDSLPEELRKQYVELVKYYEDNGAADTQIIDVIGLVILVSGGTAVIGKMMEFISTGKLTTALGCIFRALIAVTAGRSRYIIQKAIMSLKFVKIAGTVISILEVFINAVILVISAIKGAEQRKSLEEYVVPHNIVNMKRKLPIDGVVDEICDDLKKGLEGIKFDKVYDILQALDKSYSTTWSDEDPSKENLQRWWKDGNDPTQYKGPVPDKHLEGNK